MNKEDLILVSIVIVIFFLIIGLFKITEKKDNLNALVYYEDDLVLTIDLKMPEKEYKVKGYNGMVSILAGNGKIKVQEENSPLHLCSKSGYISKSYETIVCLPNKIVIKIDAVSELDTVIE